MTSPRSLRTWPLVAAVAFVLAACGGSTDVGTPTATAPAGGSTSAPGAATSEPAPVESESPSETAEPLPDPVKYSGRGNKVLKIKKPTGEDAVLATLTHSGSSNFAVWTVDADLNETKLIVNTIGDYKGTVLFDEGDGEDSRALKIEADGKWTVVIKPLLSARTWSESVKGTGDDVLIYTGDAGIITANGKGDGNFAIWFYGEDGRDLLYNEIGPIKGMETTIPTGPGFLEVTAEKAWTLSVAAL